MSGNTENSEFPKIPGLEAGTVSHLHQKKKQKQKLGEPFKTKANVNFISYAGTKLELSPLNTLLKSHKDYGSAW